MERAWRRADKQGKSGGQWVKKSEIEAQEAELAKDLAWRKAQVEAFQSETTKDDQP
jgi:hypothetical protein